MTEQMTANKPNQTPSLLTALNHLRATIKPGSFVYMISDFQNVDTEDASAIESQLSQINRHNDLMSIMIHDPAEHTLPGRTRFAISDGIEKRRIDPRSRAIQKAHQARFDRHHHRLKTLLPIMASPH